MDIATVELFWFPPPTFGWGRVLFLPASPCFAPAGTATLEFSTVAVLDNHVVPGQRMVEPAEFELCDDDRPLYPVMRRVAASFPNASWHLAGQNAVIGRNNPDERLRDRRGAGRRPSNKTSSSEGDLYWRWHLAVRT